MKIFFYINTISDGGAERVLTLLANQMSYFGNEVTVITSYKNEDEYSLNKNVTRIVLGNSTKQEGKIMRNYHLIFSLREECLSQRPDFLISFMEEANSRALIATIGTKIKNVISIRTDPYSGYNIISKFLAMTLYRKADGYVFQTETARSWFVMSIQNKAKVIANPVSDSFFGSCYQETKQSKKIVSTGRLVRSKNYELLIEAFSMIKKEFSDYELIIYGEGDFRDKLNKRIKDLNLDNCVQLFGRCNDVAGKIKDASVFVLSSDIEGLPNALMEAMVLGLPVISTDCSGGGARALIKDGSNGLIVPVNDKNALAHAIKLILSDKEYARRLGNNAKKTGKSFKAEEITKQWLDYMQQIKNL